MMDPEELRCWAIDAAIRTGGADIIATARDIVEFVRAGGAVAIAAKGVPGAWKTPERLRYLEANYSVEPSFKKVLAALNAMPGAWVGKGQVSGWVNIQHPRPPRPGINLRAKAMNLARAANAARRAAINGASV
jgi:hypothetical protein